MDTEEKLRVLRWELVERGYARNTAMCILIQEKIEELERVKIKEESYLTSVGMRVYKN